MNTFGNGFLKASPVRFTKKFNAPILEDMKYPINFEPEKMPSLFFVIPCFNEEKILKHAASQLLNQIIILASLGLCCAETSRILFVDDGSSDKTWHLIQQLSSNENVTGIRLSCNKGHQAAIMAGLEIAHLNGDVAISIDADLQDDITKSAEMMNFYRNGAEVVYGVRFDRNADTFTKRFFAEAFYSLSNKLGIKIIPNHADFRLLSKRAMHELLRYKEKTIFLRGIVTLMGYNSATVFYRRSKRIAGKSKYPFAKSLKLAVDGMLSFTDKPLIAIVWLSLLMLCISLIGVAYVLFGAFTGNPTAGWTSIVIIILLAASFQMLSIGIIGSYVAKIYYEVKNRPRYHIQEYCGDVKHV